MKPILTQLSILFVFIFICFGFIQANAKSPQIALIDSLQNEIDIASREVDIDRMLKLSLEALSISEKSKHNKGIIHFNYWVGQSLFYKQEYKKALSYLSKVDKIKGSEKYPESVVQAYKVKGQIYFYLEMVDKSIKEFH